MAFAIEQRLFKGVLEDYVVQTGGSNDPDDIINAGYGTEVGYQTIYLPNHLAIEGVFNCDDWTYITAPNKQITASSPNTVWTSGRILNGFATGGSSFVFDNSYPIQNQEFAANNANLKFYGVKITGNQAGSNLRMEFGTLNAASYLKIRSYRLSYITLGWGSIAYAELTYDYMKFLRFGGTTLPTISSLTHLSPAENNLYNQIYNGVIPVSNYLPLGNGTTQFLHQVGSDRRFILTDPTLDVDSITIQDNGEVVQINQTLDISLAQVSGSKIDNIDLKFHTQDNTHTFSVNEETTDVQGKASANIENVWLGFGQTVNGYFTPTNVTKRTDFAMSVVDLVLDPKTENYTAAQGSIVTSIPVVKDGKLTETNAATISAYADLGTEQVQRFYDLAKLDWVDGWTPTRVFAVGKEGNTIVTDKNVVVDGLAVANYNYDGTTIIVKNNAYNQGLSTSGTITLSNVSNIDNATFTEANLQSEIVTITGLVCDKLNLEYNYTTKVEFVGCTIGEIENLTTNNADVDLGFTNTVEPILTETNGLLNVPVFITIKDLQSGNLTITAVDTNDINNPIFEASQSNNIVIDVSDVIGDLRFTVDKPEYYANTFTHVINGSETLTVALDRSPNVSGSEDISLFVNNHTENVVVDKFGTFDVVQITVITNLEYSISQWCRCHDYLTEKIEFLRILNASNIGAQTVFETNSSGIIMKTPSIEVLAGAGFDVKVKANVEQSQANLIAPTYEYAPKNFPTTENRVILSLDPLIVDYDLQRSIIEQELSELNREEFKADTSALATQASVDGLNDFNPITDTVSRVTLVDTTTTNTDMRGTDDAAKPKDIYPAY